MFTKPIDEITYQDVESFCQEWAESVRVEYKQKITQVPKIVSSFANTYGGIFLIGVEADNTTNMPIFPIKGIPKRRNIEEGIQQSAEMSINPPVRPEVKIVNVPNGDNVVVVIRVTEGSLLAPHAIEDSTKAYFRVGSVTQPYELKPANMELLAHMFKRREDSQTVAQQILDRIEQRARRRFRPSEKKPDITIIAKPVFAYRPVISASDIYRLYETKLSPLGRVEGGIFYTDGGRYVGYLNTNDYIEFNEYGIVYRRAVLSIYSAEDVDCNQFLFSLKGLVEHTMDLYKKCEYLGNIEISIHMQEVLRLTLIDSKAHNFREEITSNLSAKPECFDTEVFASKQCFAGDLESEKTLKDIVEDLMCQLLWAFNLPIDRVPIREKVRKRIEREFS